MAATHRTNELRSIELHRRIAERLDGEVIAAARARVRGWIAEAGPVPTSAANDWLALLDGPREELIERLTEDSERMRDLRQNTPFAGVVPNADRWEIVRTIR